MLITFLILSLSILWGIAAWRWPQRVVTWFPLLLPTYLVRTHLGPFPTTLLEMCTLTLCAGVTLRNGWRPWLIGWNRAEPWFPALFLWLVATGVAVFVAPHHLAALGLWRAFVLEPLIYFLLLLSCLDHLEQRRKLIRSLVFVTLGIVLWAVLQFITGHGIPHPWDTALATRRATGPFPFPNALSLFVAPISALCFSLLIFKRRDLLDSRLAWIGGISGMFGILLAKSAGGAGGLATGIFIALLWQRSTRRIALYLATIMFALMLLIPMVRGPFVQTLTFHGWSGKVRLIIWKESFSMLKEHPIFGAGFGAYPDVIKPYHKATYIEIFQYPHNILLNLWSETGILGLVAFGLIVATWIKLTRPNSWFLFPLIAILVHGLVDVPYFKNDLAFVFWMLAALTTPLQPPDKKTLR